MEAESVDVKGEHPRDLPPHYPDAHLAVDLPDHGVVFFTHADPGNPPIYRSSGGAQDRPVAPTYSDLGSDEAIFGLLFEAMGGPAGDPADGEGGSKEVSGEAEAVQELPRSVAAAGDPAGYDLWPAAVVRTGAKILRLGAGAVGGEGA